MIDFHSACCHCFVIDDVVRVVFLMFSTEPDIVVGRPANQ